jgi:hypothetical protein
MILIKQNLILEILQNPYIDSYEGCNADIASQYFCLQRLLQSK